MKVAELQRAARRCDARPWVGGGAGLNPFLVRRERQGKVLPATAVVLAGNQRYSTYSIFTALPATAVVIVA